MSNGISTAIPTNRLASVSGYKIEKGNFGATSQVLPQNVLVISTGNLASNTPDKIRITSAKQAAELYGYGTSLHRSFLKMYPESGEDVMKGVPTYAMAATVDVPGGSPSLYSERDLSFNGSVTKDQTVTVYINNETSFGNGKLEYFIKAGEAFNDMVQFFADTINGWLNVPCTAASVGGTLQLVSKTIANGASPFDHRAETNVIDGGITFGITGSNPDVSASLVQSQLDQISQDWHTIISCPIWTLIPDLEELNGNQEDGTGNYSPSNFKPFAAFSASKNPGDITAQASTRKELSTTFVMSQPYGLPIDEITVSYAIVASVLFNQSPHLDVSGQTIQAPSLSSTDEYFNSSYDNRDYNVKNGISTSVWNGTSWTIEDLVSTYHPDGENPFQFSYLRNLIIDWNIKFGYDALEKLYVRNHVIVKSGQTVSASKTVSPEQWKAILYGYWDELADRALITEPEFSKAGTFVEVDPTNPNRFNTLARYKRSGFARIESTTVQTGF